LLKLNVHFCTGPPPSNRDYNKIAGIQERFWHVVGKPDGHQAWSSCKHVAFRFLFKCLYNEKEKFFQNLHTSRTIAGMEMDMTQLYCLLKAILCRSVFCIPLPASSNITPW
jgi:hypothetical protein